jgi:hypothetical protein
MDVCDLDGNKIGSVSRVFRHEMAGVGAGSNMSQAGVRSENMSESGMPREELIEVKTGLLGLGKHLYVPFSAVQDVTSGCVFVNTPKDRVDEMGWDVKPDYIDEMS